ncbi:hypothetical protein V6N12_050706 [Hibiscus sabdariffa]|uniref:Uncharacterized protein n=1 Tax=Hibiscus sabdariffa TaxID=183260 RepID=A0ABR2GDD1_9ROSI
METGPIHLGMLKTGRFPSPTKSNQDRFGSGYLFGSGRVTQDPRGRLHSVAPVAVAPVAVPEPRPPFGSSWLPLLLSRLGFSGTDL